MPIKKKSRAIHPDTIKKLISQASEELIFARDYKEKAIERWQVNQNMLSHDKEKESDSRANTGITNTKATGYASTLLSKIDTAPNITFNKTKEADLDKAQYTNAIFEQDMSPQNQNLQFKDLLGKKMSIWAGRAIYDYHASSVERKYKSTLNLLSPYNFFIDPSAGGLDIERAYYLGKSGIWKSKDELKDKSKGKKPLYRKDAVSKITANKGDSSDESEENNDKAESTYLLTDKKDKLLEDSNRYHFVEWYTTYKGDRYYILFHEGSKEAIRISKMKELYESELYPFWSWATDPELDEFWSLAPLDNVRSIFRTQGDSINQMVDNAERINRPVRGVTAGSVKNLSDLRYGRDKVVTFKRGTDMGRAIKVFETPELKNPAEVYNMLEGIGNLESGVNPSSKGIAEEDKVGIYEGNVANTADRLGLLNKSYADGYHRFAKLYYEGLKENMIAKISLKLQGANGINYVDVTSKDIKPSQDFEISVDASDAELQADKIDKRNKIVFLQSKTGSPVYNQKVKEEMEAEIAGFSKDEVNRLLDVNETEDAELLAQAAKDIDELVAGNTVKPNIFANIAYAQKILDYMKLKHEELDNKQFKALEDYLASLKEIVVANAVRKANDVKTANQQQIIETQGNVQPNRTNSQGSVVNPNPNVV